MCKIRCIPHESLDTKTRAAIIALKQQCWPFDAVSQEEWMRQNLRAGDLHMLMEKDDTLLSYLNLVRVGVTIGEFTETMYGIGNVCTDREHLHRGYASQLIARTNAYIASKNMRGVLLCHAPLVALYGNCGWTDVTDNVFDITVAGEAYSLKLMFYGLSLDTSGKNISVDRNF